MLAGRDREAWTSLAQVVGSRRFKFGPRGRGFGSRRPDTVRDRDRAMFWARC